MFDNISPHPENSTIYEIMLENIVDPDRPQMPIWRMRIACWIPKIRHANTHYVTLIAFDSKNVCTTTPRCCVLRALPVLLICYILFMVLVTPLLLTVKESNEVLKKKMGTFSSRVKKMYFRLKTKILKTHISTRSTLIPQASVASSSVTCMLLEIVSLSLSISCSGRMPSVFLRVVCASRRVE